MSSLALLFLLSAYMLFSRDYVDGAPAMSVDTLTERYISSMQSGNYRRALEYAYEIRTLASGSLRLPDKMLADSYIGQAYLAGDKYDSAYAYLTESLDIWKMSGDTCSSGREYAAVYSSLNGLGIYSIVREMNYGKAVEYFLTGMRLAEENNSYYHYAVLGSNLVYTYNLRQDTSGLAYAREIYRYGRRAGNGYLIFTGSSTSAMMFYLKNDLDSAVKYAEEAVRLAGQYSDKAGVYALYGDILQYKGNDVAAGKYYRQALSSIGGTSTTTAISIYLSYGQFLLHGGKYAEALEYLEKGLELADSTDNHIFTYRLYLAESEAYERLGDYSHALDLYKQFHFNSQEALDLQMERTLNELTRKYENEKHEKEIQQNSLTIVRKNKALTTAVFIIVLVLAGSGMIWVMYRHKNRMYSRIARQYKDAIGKERSLEMKIDMLEQKLKACSPSSSPVIDRNEEIFDRLEHIMRKDKVYHEKGLTRDKVAQMLGTNRTYLSQIINERTGMSFVYYVNSLRIDEALEILSDPDNDAPLKAVSLDLGFSSMTSFYTFFQRKVGMTPAKYRDEVRQLSDSTNCRTR